METGKERLSRDAVRDATRTGGEQMKRGNAELKHLAAELSLEVYRLKNSLTAPGGHLRHQSMSAGKKAAALARVEGQSVSKCQVLAELGAGRQLAERWLWVP
jgi:hypothetical protein